MTSITLNDDAMNAIMVKSIVDTLTPERREAILSDAVKSLMTVPSTDIYGRNKTSPLEDAFKQAARIVTERYALEALEKDETFKEKIASLFNDVATRLFASEVREKLINKIVEDIVSGLTARNY